MHLRQHLNFLYNGGLNPDTANPDELRRRRILSACIFSMSPVGFALMIANVFYDSYSDNYAIGPGIAMVFVAIYIQASLNRPRFAANLCVFALFLIPSGLMIRHGIIGTPILWMLLVPTISILLVGRRSGIIWCIACIGVISLFYILETSGILVHNRAQTQIALANLGQDAIYIFALEASLILIILTGATIVFRNAQMNAESKLRSTVHSLRNEVHTRSLAEEEARLSEKAKSAFLAAMGHELRTPLNGVIGATRLLKVSETDKDKEELTEIIVQSSETLLELINNVMDLSSLESGKLELERLSLDLREVVAQTIAPLEFQARSRGIKLEKEFSQDLPYRIYGDPTRLRQILINLLGNSIKFTETGSVKLVADVAYDKLRLRIIDTGIGIPVDAQAKLFEPYVQAEVDTTRKYGGSGLGLSIVKKLVSAMGGKILLESVPGEGSMFTLFLPLEPANDRVIPEAQYGESVLPRLKALVVDDNAVNRMVLARLLENDHHEVVSVTNGREAVDYIDSHNLDVVLMDIQMPEMDGLEAARKIRELKGVKAKLPIIAITANTSKEEQSKAMASGMNGFIAKPFRYDELVHELQLTLNPEVSSRPIIPN